MPSRQRVSAEAVDRAIKAQMALTYGIKDARITQPIEISRMSFSEDGRNWSLQITTVPDDLGPTLSAAADAVARRLNLN